MGSSIVMNQFDVIEELMDTEPFIRAYPTFAHYVKEMSGISLDLALEFYASHVEPGEALAIVDKYS